MANFNIDYLVVAGGGGGGGSAWTTGGASGGGGGGGEYLYQTSQSLLASTPYSITVGSGGAASGYAVAAGQGSDSEFNSTTVNGGGRGASGNGIPYATETPGGSGGSGGGGAAAPSGNTPASGGSSVIEGGGLGFAGGSFTTRSTRWGSGGGGGAGSVGANGNSSSGGDGGNGASNSITGTNTTYAGGGGGGTFGGGTTYAGSGGTGGGGDATATTGSNGANNKGAGGGGGSYSSAHYGGGTGGSGVVILRYATADVAGYTTTGSTPTETTVGTDTVLSFTTVGTGTITFTASPTPTRISSALVDFNSGTEDGLKLPSGDDANQPTGVQGMIRNNTDSGMSFYNGTEWITFEATTPPLPTVTLTNSWRAWDTASFVNGNNSCTDVTGGLVLGPYSSGSPGAFFYGSFNNVAGNKYWVMNGGGSHARRAGFNRPTEFTVSYWGNKPNNPGFNSERAIWSFNVNGANSIRLARRNNANTQSLRIYSGNSAIATFADGITTNTWYNITLTFSSNTVKTYVGVQGSTNTTLINTTTLSSGNFPTGVSNNSGGTGFWIATNSGYTDWLTDSWSGLNIYDGVARQAEIDTIVSNGYQQ